MQLTAILFFFAAMIGLVMCDYHYADLAQPKGGDAMVSK